MIVLACALILAGASLPEHGPVPDARPDMQAVATPADENTQAQAASDDERPEAEKPEAETGDELKDCLAALSASGARFETVEPIEDGNGCGITHPLRLDAFAGNIALEPPATLRCETALRLAGWIETDVKPALEIALPGESLKTVGQASDYACRKRNGAETGRISEHAFGNAIDIASFTLSSGRTFAIEPREKGSTLEDAFQRAITASACLHFSTVLDPGSDKAHEDHLHLDVKARKGGYRYCW